MKNRIKNPMALQKNFDLVEYAVHTMTVQHLSAIADSLQTHSSGKTSHKFRRQVEAKTPTRELVC